MRSCPLLKRQPVGGDRLIDNGRVAIGLALGCQRIGEIGLRCRPVEWRLVARPERQCLAMKRNRLVKMTATLIGECIGEVAGDRRPDFGCLVARRLGQSGAIGFDCLAEQFGFARTLGEFDAGNRDIVLGAGPLIGDARTGSDFQRGAIVSESQFEIGVGGRPATAHKIAVAEIVLGQRPVVGSGIARGEGKGILEPRNRPTEGGVVPMDIALRQPGIGLAAFVVPGLGPIPFLDFGEGQAIALRRRPIICLQPLSLGEAGKHRPALQPPSFELGLTGVELLRHLPVARPRLLPQRKLGFERPLLQRVARRSVRRAISGSLLARLSCWASSAFTRSAWALSTRPRVSGSDGVSVPNARRRP